MKNKFYYGWVNLAILLLTYFAIMSSVTYAYGVVSVAMAADLKMTLTVASGGYTCYTLCCALVAPASGSFIRKYGTKKCIILGLLLVLTGSGLMGFVVNGPVLYFIAYSVLIGIGIRFSTLVPCQANLTKWFFAKRGMTFSILMAGGGIGGYVFAPMFAKLNSAYSWRSIWMTIAACSAICLVLVVLFLKENPADVGQEVDNGITVQKAQKVSRVYKTKDKWTFNNALKTKQLYGIIMVFIAASMLLSGVSACAITHLTDGGMDATDAAAIVGSFALFNMLSRLFVGFFLDRVEAKQLLVFGAVISIAGLCILLKGNSMAACRLSLILVGIGYGVLMVTPNNMLANYYGSNDFARISAFFSLVSGLAAAPNPTIFAMVRSATGSYDMAWMMLVGVCALCVLIGLIIRPPAYKGHALEQ